MSIFNEEDESIVLNKGIQSARNRQLKTSDNYLDYGRISNADQKLLEYDDSMKIKALSDNAMNIGGFSGGISKLAGKTFISLPKIFNKIRNKVSVHEPNTMQFPSVESNKRAIQTVIDASNSKGFNIPNSVVKYSTDQSKTDAFIKTIGSRVLNQSNANSFPSNSIQMKTTALDRNNWFAPLKHKMKQYVERTGPDISDAIEKAYNSKYPLLESKARIFDNASSAINYADQELPLLLKNEKTLFGSLSANKQDVLSNISKRNNLTNSIFNNNSLRESAYDDLKSVKPSMEKILNILRNK